MSRLLAINRQIKLEINLNAPKSSAFGCSTQNFRLTNCNLPSNGNQMVTNHATIYSGFAEPLSLPTSKSPAQTRTQPLAIWRRIFPTAV